MPDLPSTMDDPLDPFLSLAFAAREGRVEARGESVVAQLGLQGGFQPTPLAFGPTTPGAPADPEGTARPASANARYQILDEIGRGGLGLVLRGRDVDLRRDVAVKVLRARLADRKDLVERFLLEAQLGGQLQHPGVAPVYDLGITRDGRPFFTMKLVQGSTLAELLAAREGSEGGTVHLLAIFSQICKAVGYAHARGVVHRDLKPENVMVGEFGEVQVVDWGLAKVSGHVDELEGEDPVLEPDLSASPDSRPGTALGTPGYMAPEQARGEAAGPASDVYSLGVMLLEILAGRPQHEEESERNRTIDGERIRELMGGQDAELQGLVLACLAPDPAGRPRDALEVAHRIDAHLARSEQRAQEAEIRAAREEARADEVGGRLQAESRARRLSVVTAAVVLVALVAGGGTWAVIAAQASSRELAASLEIEEAVGRAAAKRAEALASERTGAWTEALEAARGALAIAELQAVKPSLETRAHALVVELEEQLRRALERDRRLVLRESLAGDLGKIRAQVSQGLPPKDYFAALQRSFAAYGHDLEDGFSPELETSLAADGLLESAIQVLDTLGVTARKRHGMLLSDPRLAESAGLTAADFDFADGWATFWNLAQALDEDPERKELRELSLAGDTAGLRARSEALLHSDTAAPTTLALAAGALRTEDLRDDATRLWRRAVEVVPDSYWAREGLGTTLGDGGKWEEAIAQFEAGTALAPNDATAWCNLGAALGTVGRSEESLEKLRRAVRLEPAVGLFRWNLALALKDLGRYEETVEAIDGWLEVQPGNGAALAMQAKAYVQLVDPAGLRRALEGLRRLHVEDESTGGHRTTAIDADVGSLLTEGNLWSVLCEPALAREAFEAALDLRPDYPEALINLGALLERDYQEYESGLDLRRGGHELGSQQASWRFPSGAWVAISERRAAMARLFADEGASVEVHSDPEDGGLLAQVAYRAGDMVTCLRLLTALEGAGEPGWEFQDSTGDYTWLMWAKALLARAQDSRVPAEERADLQRAAADRLRRELAGMRDSEESVDRRHVRVIRRMVDPGLATVRGQEALDGLDAQTAGAWRAYWQELEDYRRELRSETR